MEAPLEDEGHVKIVNVDFAPVNPFKKHNYMCSILLHTRLYLCLLLIYDSVCSGSDGGTVDPLKCRRRHTLRGGSAWDIPP